MPCEGFVQWLKEMKQMFLRSSSALTEEDSMFAPVEGMYTAAQHVAQVAMTVDWFVEGGLGDKPFDLNFEEAERKVREVQSLTQARQMLEEAFQRVIDKTASMDPAKLNELMPPGPILGGVPRHTIFGAICDHTAHHRGALTVYAQLLGKTPPMPYE